jgi:hypothetical protein
VYRPVSTITVSYRIVSLPKKSSVLHLFIPPSLPPTSGKPEIFLSLVLLFSRMSMSHSCIHRGCSCFRLASFIPGFSLSIHGLIYPFFLAPNNIPWFACPQFIYHSPTEGHLHCFQVLEIMNKSCYKHFCSGFLYVVKSFG